jgi:hypothetical protein
VNVLHFLVIFLHARSASRSAFEKRIPALAACYR